MSEITIVLTTNHESELLLTNFVIANENHSLIEKTSSFDGQEFISLVITNLPATLTALAALITALRSKNISFKALKDGKEIDESELLK